MKKKLLKKAWKHKTKIGLGLTHGAAFGVGAVTGTKTAFSIVNFDPHQRVQNKKMRELQEKFNKNLNKSIQKALKEKGYKIDKKKGK